MNELSSAWILTYYPRISLYGLRSIPRTTHVKIVCMVWHIYGCRANYRAWLDTEKGD